MDYYDYYDYYGYGYGMEDEFLEIIETAGFAILGLMIGILLIMMALMVVVYVFQSLGLYTIAKRRDIQNPWLAWVPIGNYWILGSISDQYQYVTKNKVTNKRKILLWISIASFAVQMVMNIVSNAFLAAAGYDSGMMAGGIATSMLSAVISWGLSIVTLVFWHMALYDLYGSCSPKNQVLFLVLGIVCSITTPFFVFANRKKDDGMHPPMPPAGYIPPQPQYQYQYQYQQPQDPWNRQ
ncbi:MAG: hypothetical protein IJX69_01150 [Oscillospiraceae bacterium]|nr:hypothetical protein [Oscillospiraceae bacterium]